ncbi:uncharacterized protein GGS22DRAFT_165294 [Annulohypoxylon maeteangense]|uniref:uncharacterized protein n=1 Tax=Annulohypoxylon maeteangense TaxID=1927788 RepID=UPI0020072D58|nr:uncharacterized protein GGS22DRAFT_165294 [Annulohypoxylon maeteangense]KAI0884291.1 hypothetical protein GGS22DRAFT_165294 [Annulohypoxylon maeteangense]
MMGGQNCHAEVVFADGVVWLARFRLTNANSPPQDVRDHVLRSEAATMEFLQLYTNIPSPRVYDWAYESDPMNEVGVGYILMEKLSGTPLDWQGATAEQREKVVRQLADIMLEIERHPFDKLGSLIGTTAMPGGEKLMPRATDRQILVQGLAKHSTSRSGKDGGPLGPFSSSQEASRALVEAHLRMIAGGEIGTLEKALDVFLAHRFRVDMLEDVWKSEGGKEQFFLKHADDKGDHILVNADFEITGIIDWEWCSTASREEAFSSPCMMWPVAAFYDGSNELADEELLLARVFGDKGREDLAACVLEGRKVQRWLFALGPGGASQEDKRTFACLFMGLKRVFNLNGGGGGEERKTEEDMIEEEWELWKAGALLKWKDDDMLQDVLKSAERSKAISSITRN